MTLINRWPVRAAMAVAVATAVAACGAAATNSSPSGGKLAQVSVTAPNSGCGSFTAATPADPDHVLPELSSADRAALAGYLTGLKGQVSILKSNWSDWKPSHKPPYTVGVAWIGPVNDSERLSLQGVLATLKASPLVKNVITEVVSSVNVPEQIQQYNQIVSQKPDIMLLSPVLVGANESSINAAAKRGIPTVAMLGGSTDPNVVAVDGNTYLNTALQASYIARNLDGKGTVLYVHGLAGANPDVSGEAGFNAVLAHCPGMKAAQGAVYGEFLPAAAQSQTAQYLATHPAAINAVWQAAEMTSGIMQAFQRAGRPMPLIADTAPDRASLGYWESHHSTYHGIAGAIPSVPVGDAVGEVALRMLAGQEVKTNDIVGANPLISDTNLDQWSSPSWTLDTAGGIPGLPGSFLPASLLNGYFKHPGPVK
jgi:ribose transport system substrate-binding protein